MLKSTDVSVQHTNDESVLSKRSAVLRRYCADPFLRAFVSAKPTRRAPLINRGYWLRMAVMSELVSSLFDKPPFLPADGAGTGMQCLSLGAGYDTLALRSLSSAGLDTSSTESDNDRLRRLRTPSSAALQKCRWFEADFPAVLHQKANLLNQYLATFRERPDELRGERIPQDCRDIRVEIQRKPSEVLSRMGCVDEDGRALALDEASVRGFAAAPDASIELVGCDLRGPDATVAELERRGFDFSLPTVVYAECVLQYLPREASTAMLKVLVGKFSGGAVFLTYDQIRPHDDFGGRMHAQLASRQSPLLGCADGLVDPAALAQRALGIGLEHVHSTDFVSVAQEMMPAGRRAFVDALEAFDEMEEWDAKCKHYALTFGIRPPTAKSSSFRVPDWKVPGIFERKSTVEPQVPHPTDDDARATTETLVTEQPWPEGRKPEVSGWGHAAASAFFPDNETLLVTFGGFTKQVSASSHGQARSNALHATFINADASQAHNVSVRLRPGCNVPRMRMQHGFARMSSGSIQNPMFVAWGGRDGPSAVLGDAWCVRVSCADGGVGDATVVAEWQQLEQSGSVPAPRYRHGFASCPDSGTVVVVGGCGPDHGLLGDACIGRTSSEFNTMSWTLAGVLPDAVHSPLIVRIGVGQFAVFGGRRADGSVSRRGAIIETTSGTVLAFELPHGVQARYSGAAFAKPQRDGDASRVLLLGGLGPAPSTEKSMDCVDIAVGSDPGGSRAVAVQQVGTTVESAVSSGCVRSVAAELAIAGRYALLGGGFTCFSFGPFFRTPTLIRCGPSDQDAESAQVDTPHLSSGPSGATTAETGPRGSPDARSISATTITLPPFAQVKEMPCPSADKSWVDRGRMPVVFRDVDLGLCTSRWTPEYLSEHCADVDVAIHVSKSSDLEFVDKNYSVRSVKFPELVAQCFPPANQAAAANEETWYFRSVGRRPGAKTVADVQEMMAHSFPEIARDFRLGPDAMRRDVTERLHQSVLRVNQAGMRLWTHYDTLDNVLCQIVGRKRVILFPPSAYPLLYMRGSSSAVANVDRPDLRRFPLFLAARQKAVEVELAPGDVLFIPNFWMHQVVAVDACVSVNCFFERLPHAEYDSKDAYGNRDPAAVVSVRTKALDAVRDVMARTSTDDECRDFALQQVLADLLSNGITAPQ